jgi:hypothetical protein
MERCGTVAASAARELRRPGGFIGQEALQMWLKKTSSSPAGGYYGPWPVDVLLEPLDGHSAAEVARSIQRLGASDVNLLGHGWVSARADAAALSAIEDIAHVHTQDLKSPRAF